MKFCNIHGAEIDVTEQAKQVCPKAKPQRKTKQVFNRVQATQHHGFVVTGCPPDGGTQRARVHRKLFEVERAALDCAELARCHGWHDVRVEELLFVEVGPEAVAADLFDRQGR